MCLVISYPTQALNIVSEIALLLIVPSFSVRNLYSAKWED
jgi:hypothetical protein